MSVYQNMLLGSLNMVDLNRFFCKFTSLKADGDLLLPFDLKQPCVLVIQGVTRQKR